MGPKKPKHFPAGTGSWNHHPQNTAICCITPKLPVTAGWRKVFWTTGWMTGIKAGSSRIFKIFSCGTVQFFTSDSLLYTLPAAHRHSAVKILQTSNTLQEQPLWVAMVKHRAQDLTRALNKQWYKCINSPPNNHLSFQKGFRGAWKEKNLTPRSQPAWDPSAATEKQKETERSFCLAKYEEIWMNLRTSLVLNKAKWVLELNFLLLQKSFF